MFCVPCDEVIGDAAMRMIVASLAACMLLLSLMGGTAANASAPHCGSVPAESVGHFDGDRDQVPSCPAKSSVHHHAPCAHSVAVPTPEVQATHAGRDGRTFFQRSVVAPPGRSPPSLLRPPIA